jgi:hypothetical protein
MRCFAEKIDGMLSQLGEYQRFLGPSDRVSFKDKMKGNVAKINFSISIKGHSKVAAELDDSCNDAQQHAGEPS